MHDLTSYQNSIWLAEPSRLQRLAVQVASIPMCPTSREMVDTRRAWAERARSIADGATLEIGGEDAEEMMAANSPTKAVRAVKGKIGVIPIYGPVSQRATPEMEKAGGTPLDFVSASLDSLVNNSAIGAIILHIDSPGGGVYGTMELSDKIYAARAAKPIYAMVDSMAASAGYWLASAASMVVCTPGGDVGSVGVYCMHVNQAGKMEKDGVSVTMISAGPYKTELSPYGPLSDDAKAALQDSVDETYGKFVQALRANRNTTAEHVRASYGGGRLVSSEKALAAGMVDRIMTFEQLLAKLVGKGGASPAGKAAADALPLRLRSEHRARKAAARERRLA